MLWKFVKFCIQANKICTKLFGNAGDRGVLYRGRGWGHNQRVHVKFLFDFHTKTTKCATKAGLLFHPTFLRLELVTCDSFIGFRFQRAI